MRRLDSVKSIEDIEKIAKQGSGNIQDIIDKAKEGNNVNNIISSVSGGYQPKSDVTNPKPPKSGSNAAKEDKKIDLLVDVSKDIIQPLFDSIDLENSQCEPVEMPTTPKDEYVMGRYKEQPFEGFSIHVPKTIAKIKFLGNALVINVPDNCKGFIKPTKRQIKNLKKHFCIDVELMDEIEKQFSIETKAE